MIDVKEAIECSLEFMKDIYSDDLDSFEAIRVEEVDYSESEDIWLITLGWTDRSLMEPPGPFAQISGTTTKPPRTYKTFHVHEKDGTVKKMGIRET